MFFAECIHNNWSPASLTTTTSLAQQREIISLHVGQFGVKTGNALWELYCHEHDILPNGELNEPQSDKTGFEVFFQQSTNGRYTPRAIFTDLESSVIDQVRTGLFKDLHRPERLISGKEDASNNYARGRYTIGQEQLEETAEAIRLQAEGCDQMTGFLSFHSLGGGTGSGFSSLIDEVLNEEYNKKGLMEIALFPSQKMSTSLVEPYNTVLATHAVMKKTNCVILVDNEAMFNLCTKNLHLDYVGYNHLNQLLAQAMSATTCSLRFDSQQPTNLTDFHTNLIPYPRLHFPVISLSPIVSPDELRNNSINLVEMSSRCLDKKHRMSMCDYDDGLCMACCVIFRGDVAPNESHEATGILKKKMRFVDWCPTGFKIGLTNNIPVTIPGSGIGKSTRLICMLCNNTAMQDVWKQIYVKYNKMLSKGAFCHWYLSEGLEQSEFQEAGIDIQTLIADYKEVSHDIHY